MNRKGAHPIHRAILDHWLWNDKPFAMGQALIDLILLANHTDQKVCIKGRLYIIQRGQLLRSKLHLGERWGWQRGKVDRFLQYLKDDTMIEQRSDQHTTIITLLNYDRLHKEAFKTRTPDDTTGVQRPVKNDTAGEKADVQQIGQPITREKGKNDTTDSATESTSNDATPSKKQYNVLKNILNNNVERASGPTPPKASSRTPKNPLVVKFLEWWCVEYLQRFASPYAISWGKETVLVRGLLETFEYEKLQSTAINFFETDDAFIHKAGHTIGVFVTQVNALAVKSNGHKAGGNTLVLY